MSGGLPPPPTRSESGSFAWTDWYNQLYKLLSTTGSVSWSLVNKTGSKLSDLQSKAHSMLTGIHGDGDFHITETQATQVASLGTMSAQNIGVSGTFKSSDIPAKTITVINGIITNIV